MKYHKILSLIIFSLFIRVTCIAQEADKHTDHQIEQGVYELSFLGEKVRVQLFYTGDTLNYIEDNDRNSLAFLPHPTKPYIYEHKSDLGQAKIRVYPSAIGKSSRIKFRLKKIIWFGFKGSRKSGFEQVNQDLTNPANRLSFFMRNYNKSEHHVTMRDGVRLFTQVFTPKIQNKTRPAILVRSPYGIKPYGNKFPADILPSSHFAKDQYILVYQDIRGQFMSEGDFRQISPLLSPGEDGTDEATDSYDTMEWIINNLPKHNGNIGVHGISFGGYLASVAATCEHPALKAVSSQAPVAAPFQGDDFRRNGALYLSHIAFFTYAMGRDMENPTKKSFKTLKSKEKDPYLFYLNYMNLSTITDSIFNYSCEWWNTILTHQSNDKYWRSRSVNSYYDRMNIPILNVGGWYDGEDLNGPLMTYHLNEKNDLGNNNFLVMGPWTHSTWNSNFASDETIGPFSFKGTSAFFEEHVEKPFFAYYLDNSSSISLPEASMFDTGSQEWSLFESWPPVKTIPLLAYPGNNSLLNLKEFENNSSSTFDEFVSDPHSPVPYTLVPKLQYNRDYFTEDQRFNTNREDVISFTSLPLEEDITVAGQIVADLYVSTSGTDSDWIVKVIDVLSEDSIAGYELIVRADIMRGKYRNDDLHPQAFIPNQVTQVKWSLPDVLHTFKKGHQIKIQIQCSWFPLYDLNPQNFCDISKAKKEDFIKATQRVYHENSYQSSIVMPILKKD